MFQNWDDDPNFNIFDFIREDEQDNSNTLANQEDPKDKLWKNYQYNQVALGGTGTYDELGKFIFHILCIFFCKFCPLRTKEVIKDP